MLGTVSVLLRGIPFIYQGQEIGMQNAKWNSIDAVSYTHLGGFCYSDEEYDIMLMDAKILLEHGADGISFEMCIRDSRCGRR